MTLVTPSLVFLLASIAYTSILMLVVRTLFLVQQAMVSITSSVIRVLHLMTQVCSIAHTFLSRWFVLLVRTPSSQKSDLRPATAWSLIHSLVLTKEPILVLSSLTTTVTTEESRLQTSCDPFHIKFLRGFFGTLFFYLNNNKNALSRSKTKCCCIGRSI